MSAEYAQIPVADKFESARGHFEFMAGFLESSEAAVMSHTDLEAWIGDEGRELQRRLLQSHLELRADAEPDRAAVDGADGVARRQVRSLRRGLGSIFGAVEVVRLVYQAPGVSCLAPLDAELNLPSGHYSLGVRKLVAELVANDSFQGVVERVEGITGSSVHKRQAEELAVAAAVDFDDFYYRHPIDPALVASSSHIVLSFDGKGITMRQEDLRETTRKAAQQDKHKLNKRLTSGEKRNRKRMAEVATVYAIEPFVREAEDVVRELRPLHEVTERRPRPTSKRVWASVVEDMSKVIDDAFHYARRMDPGLHHRWVVVVDGNKEQLRQIAETAKRHGVEITVIMDLIHVLEYLWKASYCFHKDGTREAQDWVTSHLRALLSGSDPSQIAAGIRRSATRHSLSEDARKSADACAQYLIHNRKYLDYPNAIRLGFPIATGVIEGACRYLVKDRMDRTGARWSLHGAEAILRLRALRASGDFAEYWGFHLDAEKRRTHLVAYPGAQLPGRPPRQPTPRAQLRRIK